MKLLINTGGEGKRLYPLTKDIPKPMVEINGKPALQYLVEWAKKYNIEEIVMMNGYMANKIIDYFKNGQEFNIKINHSNEQKSLGSGGAIKFAQKYIDGTFAYISGDLICEVNLEKLINFHNCNQADMTLVVHESTHPEDSDIVKINKEKQIIKFISKLENHKGAGKLANTGLCIIKPKILELMDREIFNFENYIFPRALGGKMKLYAYISNEFIADIGTPERIKKCEAYLKT